MKHYRLPLTGFVNGRIGMVRREILRSRASVLRHETNDPSIDTENQ